jgi:hypothetical protein
MSTARGPKAARAPSTTARLVLERPAGRAIAVTRPIYRCRPAGPKWASFLKLSHVLAVLVNAMAIETLEPELRLLETERERIFFWRFDALLKVGYSSRVAFKLALRSDVDLHRAVELRARGCPETTTVRILL